MGRGWRRLSLICTVAFTAIAAALAPVAQADELEPVEAEGITITTGTWDGYQFTATLTARFAPQRIDPGEPFVYSQNVEQQIVLDFPDPPGCHDGSGSGEYVYWVWPGYTWQSGVFSRFWLDGTWESQSCYEGNGDSRHSRSFSVPGSATADLETGCYQFDDGFEYTPNVQRTVSGTVTTLAVGDVDCTQNDCADGQSNDFDGLVDQLDPGCHDGDNSELSAAQCDNAGDDDEDGFTDWPLDRSCSGPTEDKEADPACSDGHTNDKDDFADHPADPGCSSPDDDSEYDEVRVDRHRERARQAVRLRHPLHPPVRAGRAARSLRHRPRADRRTGTRRRLRRAGRRTLRDPHERQPHGVSQLQPGDHLRAPGHVLQGREALADGPERVRHVLGAQVDQPGFRRWKGPIAQLRRQHRQDRAARQGQRSQAGERWLPLPVLLG